MFCVFNKLKLMASLCSNLLLPFNVTFLRLSILIHTDLVHSFESLCMPFYKYVTVLKRILLLMDSKISLSYLVEKQCCNEHICMSPLHIFKYFSRVYARSEIVGSWTAFGSFAFSTLRDIAKLTLKMVVEMETF